MMDGLETNILEKGDQCRGCYNNLDEDKEGLHKGDGEKFTDSRENKRQKHQD